MKTKILLEFGCNHQGNMNIAKRMISDAYSLGVWGVKFQKRNIELIPEDLKKAPRDISKNFGHTYYEHKKALEFDIRKMTELKKHAESYGLVFACTAHDADSIVDLSAMGCEYIKLPSQLYTNTTCQAVIARMQTVGNFAVIVSTGMHTEDEILNSTWQHDADIIMHCISIYPAAVQDVNIRFIHKLAKWTNAKIGYSSHEIEGRAIQCAVLAGAEYVERHYTLNRDMKGHDHGTVSSEYREIEKIIIEVKRAEDILGGARIVTPAEKEVAGRFRR